MTRQIIGLIGAICVMAASARSASVQVDARLLSCASVLRQDASAASLAEHFGSTNVTSADIDVGEGQTEPGTVLFADSSDDRLDILWNDESAQRQPRRIVVRHPSSSAPTSRWRTSGGLTLGIRLRKMEQLNRRPFRLLGFGWDYEGTVMSWAGGVFDADQPKACRVRARLTTGELLEDPAQRRSYYQVAGEREFSSGHPAMQARDPFVYELWLEYRKAG